MGKRGHWVRGHVRNGHWVEGHHRGGKYPQGGAYSFFGTLLVLFFCIHMSPMDAPARAYSIYIDVALGITILSAVTGGLGRRFHELTSQTPKIHRIDQRVRLLVSELQNDSFSCMHGHKIEIAHAAHRTPLAGQNITVITKNKRVAMSKTGISYRDSAFHPAQHGEPLLKREFSKLYRFSWHEVELKYFLSRGLYEKGSYPVRRRLEICRKNWLGLPVLEITIASEEGARRFLRVLEALGAAVTLHLSVPAKKERERPVELILSGASEEDLFREMEAPH